MPDHVMNYISSDVAEDATLVEWRRTRIAFTRRRRWDIRILVPTRRPPTLAA